VRLGPINREGDKGEIVPSSDIKVPGERIDVTGLEKRLQSLKD